MSLTQARLKELLHYNRKTGVFTWRATRGSRAKAGAVAGHRLQKGYRGVEIEGVSYKLHRLAWLYVRGFMPHQVDHRDLDKANNSFKNLRRCDTQKNCAGRGIRRDNRSGFKGVSKVGPDRWCARIRVNYVCLVLGTFHDPVVAAKAYDRAAILHFGRFARTNKMLGLL